MDGPRTKQLRKRLDGLFFRPAAGDRLQIDALDGVRALAVTWVVLGHLSGLGMDLVPGLSLKGCGVYGVYLFFALSAFLLTLPRWGQDRAALLDRRSWRNYFVRRVLRIYPLYTLALVIYMVISDRSAVVREFIHLDPSAFFYISPCAGAMTCSGPSQSSSNFISFCRSRSSVST